MSRETSTSEEESEEKQEEIPRSKPIGNRYETVPQKRNDLEAIKNEFVATLDDLRAQLQAYVAESTQIQNDMFNRIKELKAELAELRSKSSRKTTTAQRHVRNSLYGKGAKHPRKLAQHERPISSRK